MDVCGLQRLSEEIMKVKAFLQWLFLDPRPELSELHSSTREAQNFAHCPPWPCKGANPSICEACRKERNPLKARHA